MTDMEADKVTICRANSDYSVGFSRGLVIAYWAYHTKAEYVPELLAAATLAQKECKRPVGLIQIAPPGSIAPDARARSALVQMLRELSSIVSCSALVHEAEGFRAAMVRSIVTGLAALSNPGFPHRVFAKLPEAATWMAESHELLTPEKISSAVGKLRGAIPGAKGAGYGAVARAPRSP